MLHQKEILEWLKMFTVNQIKHFLTIKNSTSLQYIRDILNYRDFKPSERMLHGYSEQKIQNEARTIYQRDKFRYKHRKEEKKAIDEAFFENITVSRANPYALSVKKEFIRSGRLSQCMLVLSDEQIFNCLNANYQQSVWFQISNINSFSMWVVRSFELEIFDAYYAHHAIHAINHFSFAEETLTQEKAMEMLENIINNHREKSNHRANKVDSLEGKEGNDRLQISKEESPYLLQKCIEKLQQQGRDLGEILFEDIWSVADRSSKIYKTFRELQQKLMGQYSEYLIDIKCQEIQSYTSKKKKKKSKKPKQQPIEPNIKKQSSKNQQSELLQKQQANYFKLLAQPEKTSQCLKQEQKIEIKQIKEQKYQQTHLSYHTKLQDNFTIAPKQSKPIKQKSVNQSTQKNSKDTMKTNEQRQRQQQKRIKKIVHERINENILNFYQQLYQSSQNFDKYRKLCFQIIKSTISQLQITSKWTLQLFGSASINFALKQSDLDLVLIIDDYKNCKLSDIYDLFRVKQWVRECHLLSEAKVPLVELQVLLSQLKNPKFKDNKKTLNNVIHVDISISYRKTPHEGLKNTSFLKQIFENHPNLMNICLILKELLRVNDLNKPYKGGIGSYVLVILVHNILKFKNIDFSDSLFEQIKTIAKYLIYQFQPFFTLITPFKNSKVKPNSDLSLNIQDPHQKILLYTSARLINEIIALFKQLHNILNLIESQMLQINIQQRKKMKRIFFQNWNILFKSEEEDL